MNFRGLGSYPHYDIVKTEILNKELDTLMEIKPKYLFFIVIILAFTAACSRSVDIPTEIPPTETAVVPPTSEVPLPPTEIPATPSEIPPTQDPNCTNEALFIADVSIPDDTVLSAGEAFVKTWQIRNEGTCTWNASYKLVFSSGEQMNSALSIPLSETPPEETLNISVDLVAPINNGSYTGIYQLQNAQEEVFNIGALDNIWLRIVVGDGAAPPPATVGGPTAPAGVCNPDRNAAYESEILSLINNARANNGLPALNMNTKLQAAADAHSKDMACNSLLSHTGSDGSSVSSRVAAQGYASSYSVENIYAGGTAQDAFTWWMNDQIHKDAILDTRISEIGIGYAYLGTSTYGGYFAVDFASP